MAEIKLRLTGEVTVAYDDQTWIPEDVADVIRELLDPTRVRLGVMIIKSNVNSEVVP